MSDPRLPPPEEEDDFGEIEDAPEPDGGEGESEEAETTGDSAEAGEDDEPQSDEAETRQVAPRRERARDTIKTLRSRAQTAEDRIADLERRLQAAEQPRQPPVDPLAQQRQLEAEMERVNQMMPHEAAKYWADKNREETRQAILRLELQNLEARDEANFNALKMQNRRAAEMAQQVEADVRQLRQAGIYTIGRTDAFYRRLGQEVAERAARAAPAQRGAAARRVAGQTTRPGNGRGGIAATTGGTRNDDEALLRSVSVRDGL